MWLWLSVIGVVWSTVIIASGVWFWYLHNKKELVTDYPYDDEM